MFLFKRSNGIYYLYFDDKLTGKRKAVSTKCKLKTDAIKFVNSFDTEKQPSPAAQLIYLATLEKEALNYALNNLSNGSYIIYKATFRYLLGIIGNKPLKSITGRDIELYKDTRIKTVKKTTCNIEIRTLKAIFNLALKWNWLNVNPMKDVKEFAIPEREHIAFSNDEITMILNNIKEDYLLNIVKFALYTGCRINEILHIQIKDINQAERIITIGNKEDFRTKSRKIRYIPISDKMLELLKDILKQKGNILPLYEPEMYLFNDNGNKFNKNYISKLFKKKLRLCGLPEKYHFHCLRHTFITNLVKAGVNINYIKQIAGHSDIKTTERYVHIGIDDLKQALNNIK